MLRRQLVNLLLIVGALVAVGALLLTRHTPSTDERLERKGRLVSVFRPDEIARIAVRSAGRQVVLERRADAAGQRAWWLLRPVEEQADPYAVDRFIAAVDRAEPLRRVAQERVDRRALGLDPTRTTVELTGESSRHILHLGGAAAVPPGAVYVEVEGDGVALVDAEVAALLDADAGFFRDKQLVPYGKSELRQVLLDGRGGRRLLKKVSGGDFVLDAEPEPLAVSRRRMDALLLQMARLEADPFIDVAAAKRALAGADPVRLSVTAEAPERPVVELFVGGSCPSGDGAIAVRERPSPAAACVPSDVLLALSLEADALVDRSLSSLSWDEVERFELSLNGASLELRRSGSGFSMTAPRRQAVDLDAGNAKIEALLDIEGTIVAPPPSFASIGHVTFWPAAEDDDQAHAQRIELARHEGALFARRLRDGVVLRLPEAAATRLAPDPDALGERANAAPDASLRPD